MVKLLILSIYNEDEYYDKMMKINNKYIDFLNLNNIKYYHILLKPIENEYIIDEINHKIIINGIDSLRPGILIKTIKAIKIALNVLKIDYDFILRTTTATNINIPILLSLLDKLDINKDYYIGNMQELKWIDINHNIVDTTYWGTIYTGGGFSIFNKNISLEMLKKQDDFLFDIVDDLAIGYFIQNIPSVVYLDWTDLCSFYGYWDSNKIIFFHNTNKKERNIDILNKENIIIHLINNYIKSKNQSNDSIVSL